MASPISRMVVQLLLLIIYIGFGFLSSAEKLTKNLQAPLFAQGSGGFRLAPPFEGPEKVYSSILKETNNPNLGNGEYSFSFETADGVQREEVGKLKKVGSELVTVVEGRYSYTSPEGLAIDVKYSADENGARSSFRFGTNPGRWEKTSTLPGLQLGSRGSFEDKGKLTIANRFDDTERGYLPPSPPVKLNNDYLPPSPIKIK